MIFKEVANKLYVELQHERMPKDKLESEMLLDAMLLFSDTNKYKQTDGANCFVFTDICLEQVYNAVKKTSYNMDVKL